MKKLIASGAAILVLGASLAAFVQGDSIEARLTGKSRAERVAIKSEAIVDADPRGTFTKNGIQIEVQSVEQIDGGVQVFARAWAGPQGARLKRFRDKRDGDGNLVLDEIGAPVQEAYEITVPAGRQFGLGPDGTTEIERFRYFDPRILVPDANGTIKRIYKGKDMQPVTEHFREDPAEALKIALANTIFLVGKPDGNIIPGKMGNTTSTFYPDADAESTSVDGDSVNGCCSDWASVHDAAAGSITADSATVIQVYSNNSGGFYNISRLFALFDTSAIPDTDSVTSANVQMYAISKVNTDNDGTDYITVVTSTPASNTALANADYDQVGTTKQSNDIDIGSLTTSAMNTWTLTAAGQASIAVAGITKFAMREGHDVENSAITVATNNLVNISAADESGSTQDPTLTVVHSAPATPKKKRVPVTINIE